MASSHPADELFNYLIIVNSAKRSMFAVHSKRKN